MLFTRYFYDADAKENAPVAALTISVLDVEEGDVPVRRRQHGYDVKELLILTESNVRVSDERLASWVVNEYTGSKVGLVFYEGDHLMVQDKGIFGLIADMNAAKLAVTNLKNVATVVEFIFNVVNPSMDATYTQWVQRTHGEEEDGAPVLDAAGDEDVTPTKEGGQDVSS